MGDTQAYICGIQGFCVSMFCWYGMVLVFRLASWFYFDCLVLPYWLGSAELSCEYLQCLELSLVLHFGCIQVALSVLLFALVFMR